LEVRRQIGHAAEAGSRRPDRPRLGRRQAKARARQPFRGRRPSQRQPHLATEIARARLDNGCGVAYAFRVAEPPRDTVSFLFTDVEGSTFLLRQLGEQVFVAHGGRQIDTQGDPYTRSVARGTRIAGAVVVTPYAFGSHVCPDEPGTHVLTW